MDKKGFFSVYACLFLVVLLAAAGLFIGGAKKSAGITMAQACSRLWAQSILAEYDQNLQQRYHLFGYYGYPAMVQEKLNFYGQETFGAKKGADLTIVSCSLNEHSLRNTEVLAKQIRTWGKLNLLDGKEAEKSVAAIQSVTHHQKPDGQTLFSDLPSDGSKTGLSVSHLVETFEQMTDEEESQLLQKGTDTYFQLAYILEHFKNQRNGSGFGETYLQNEVEYIIGGKRTDSGNEKAVKRRIIALREAVNLAYLEQDPAKSSAVYAAAEALTPGAAPLTAQSIMALWAYAESVNDYNLLQEGYVVPKVKTGENWATDLESILAEEDTSAECICTGETKGDTYEDYLRLFLLTMKEPTRLLRMMDLIQINMRYLYYDTFVIGDYYGGVSYTYNIYGETCHEEETYE